MTVGLIAHYRGPRLGIGQYLQRLLPPLVEELTLRGMNVCILASPNAFANTPAIQDLAHLVRILSPLDYSSGRRYLWSATSLGYYCKKHCLDRLVWLSNPIVFPWHPPTLAVIHDVNEWKVSDKYGSSLKTTLRAWIYLDASIRFSRKIITVSKTTANDLLHFRPYLREQNQPIPIPNGSDSSLKNIPPVEIEAPKVPFLLSVGRIDPAAKRLPEAVELVKALREITKEPWELHLVGGMNETTRDAGEAFLKSVENVTWVKYHGYLEDSKLAQWYRQATAIVFLSDNEGFGFPIAEATSFGRWVIVSQANQASLEAGAEAIIRVDPNDPLTSALAISQQFLSNPSIFICNNLPTWQSAAFKYAQEIDMVMPL